jgi:tetratricopeptide (TPR) repeat protein
MKTFRVTPHRENSSLKTRKSSTWGISFRSVRSSLTHVSTESYCEDDTDVVVSSESCVEVMANRDAATLNELAQHEYEMQRYDEAMDTWNQALRQEQEQAKEQATPAEDACSTSDLRTMILWNICKVHLELNELQGGAWNAEDAKKCFDKLRPSLATFIPRDPSPIMLDYFVQEEEWVAAQRLAELIKVEPPIMARIHYECGIQANSSLSLADKICCMIKCLACEPLAKRLKLAAHAELVQLYSAAGNIDQALKYHEERLPLLVSKSDLAKAFYEEAELYISLGNSEKAMASIEKGLAVYPKSHFLLEAKADLLYLIGKVEESIALHESILETTTDPLEKTKILYTIGRIYHKIGQSKKAATYYEQELKLTKTLFGKSHLECTRIYHELARLADEACDYPIALDYLKKALVIEQQCQQQALETETKKLMGKIHYKTGDFSRALRTSFADDAL